MSDERNRSGGRGGRGQGGRDDRRGGRDDRRGGGQRADGPRGGGQRERGRQSDGPRGGGERTEGPLMEYVLIGEDTCLAADLYATPLPLKWHRIDPVRLLKPGLYLRRSGSLSLVSRDLTFERAVMFALWEDPHASYRVDGGRWVQPGLHAGFLIRSPLSEGPPWIPIITEVDATPEEHTSGLLSPWLDQVSAVRFRAELRVESGTLKVSSAGRLEEEAGTEALHELMRWLAEHPEDDTPTGAAARLSLVRNGHGLQRLGLTLMHAEREETGRMLEEVLTPLAPDVAAVLRPLWALWTEGVQAEEGAERWVRALAEALHPALKPEAPLQRAENLALLTTWINGLFGARPDRDHVQPARSLFAVARFLRQIQRNLELFDHPDADAPTFPLDRPATAALVRDLANFPPDETDLERLLRALAVAEGFADVARPNLDFLRPFRIAYPRLHAWPIAARSLLGRYDYVLSGWSFRGHEARTGRADARRLGGNLITDQPTITGARSLARTIGMHPQLSRALTEMLGSCEHPIFARLAELAALDDDALGQAHAEAAGHPRITRIRLYDAILAAEMMLARGQRTREAPDALLDPEPPGTDQSAVRSHFMYWRMVCRSVVPALRDRYIAFIDRMLAQRETLPEKLQAELFALARRVIEQQKDPALVERWTEVFSAIARETTDAFAETEQLPHGERLDQLLGVLARLDADAWLALVTSIVRSPAINDDTLARLLDGTRRAQTARVLAASPLMRELHSRLTGGDPTHRAPARAGWVRVATGRSGKSDAVRWLLDARRNMAFFEHPAFVTWFHEKALDAIDSPADAIIDLLELAVRLVPAEDMDVLITQLRRYTTWPAEEILKLLEKAGRREAALEWMSVGGCGTTEQATFLLDAHATRLQSGTALLHAAALLPTLRRRFDDPLRDGTASLEEAFARYAPNRRLPDGFLRACDAFRLAELDPASPAGAHLANQAVEWRRDGRTHAFDLFLRACLETVASHPVHDLVASALTADAPPEDAAAALAAATADAVAWGKEHLRGKRVPLRDVAGIVQNDGTLRILETAIAAAILNALRGTSDTASEIPAGDDAATAATATSDANSEVLSPAVVRERLLRLSEATRPLTAPPELPGSARPQRGGDRNEAGKGRGQDDKRGSGAKTAMAPEVRNEPAPLGGALGDALAAHLRRQEAEPAADAPEPAITEEAPAREPQALDGNPIAPATGEGTAVAQAESTPAEEQAESTPAEEQAESTPAEEQAESTPAVAVDGASAADEQADNTPADAQASSTPAEAGGGASTTDSQAENAPSGIQSGAEEGGSAGGGSEPDGVDPADPLDAVLRATLVNRVARALQSAMAIWPDLLEVLETSQVRPRALLERLSTFHPAPARVRRDVLFPLAQRAEDAGFRVRDPVDLLTSPQLESAIAELDRMDARMILDVLMAVVDRHGLQRELIIERDGILLPLKEPKPGDGESDEGGEGTSAGAPVDASSSQDNEPGDDSEVEAEAADAVDAEDTDEADDRSDEEGVDDGSDEAGEADEAESSAEEDGRSDEYVEGRAAPSGEEGGSEDDGEGSEAGAEPSMMSRLVAVLNDKASAEELEAIFGDGATPGLLQRLVRRNPSLGLRVTRDRRHGRVLMLSLRERVVRAPRDRGGAGRGGSERGSSGSSGGRNARRPRKGRSGS